MRIPILFSFLFSLFLTTFAQDDRYIVTLRAGRSATFVSFISQLNQKRSSSDRPIELIHAIKNHDIHLVALPGNDTSLLETLRNHDDVFEIERNGQVQASSSLYVQEVGSALWHLDNICKGDFTSNNGKYEYDHLGAGVDVYVLDTGINAAHVDFGGRVEYFGSFTGSICDDCNGHGTHVAGTVGGTVYGIAKNVTLHAVQVLGDNGVGDMYTVSLGLYAVADSLKKKAIAVMSLGGERSTTLKSAVKYARARGLLMAVSAGNSGRDACNYSPADSPDVITVGAYTKKGGRADFSNYGSCVAIYAPGVSIKSAYIGSTTASETLDGTSMAAPIVAGILAQLLEQNQFLTFELAKNSLQQQSKTGATTDAPAASSQVKAAPCTTFCQNSVLAFAIGQTVSTYPINGSIVLESNGTIYSWLYYPESYPMSSFTITLLRNVNNQFVSQNQSRASLSPLEVSHDAQVNQTYQIQVRRSTNLTAAVSVILFVQIPLKCTASSDCNGNGNCKEDGTCQCLVGFYGDDCSGSTIEFLIETAMIGGNSAFLIAVIVIGVSQWRTALKKNRVDELEPLLGRDPREVSERI